MGKNFSIIAFFITLSCPAIAATDCKQVVTPVQEATCESGYDQSVSKLGEVYNRLIEKTPEKERHLLEKEQLFWEKFKSAHCDYEAIPMGKGNTMSSSVKIRCEANMNRERILELQGYPQYRIQP